MLRSLSINDVVLINRLELDFEAGFGVLTGETGAGKSILLDSLGLVLGKRAETSLIRKGAQKLSVSATFDNIKDNDFQKLLQEKKMLMKGMKQLKHHFQLNTIEIESYTARKQIVVVLKLK